MKDIDGVHRLSGHGLDTEKHYSMTAGGDVWRARYDSCSLHLFSDVVSVFLHNLLSFASDQLLQQGSSSGKHKETCQALRCGTELCGKKSYSVFFFF